MIGNRRQDDFLSSDVSPKRRSVCHLHGVTTRKLVLPLFKNVEVPAVMPHVINMVARSTGSKRHK